MIFDVVTEFKPGKKKAKVEFMATNNISPVHIVGSQRVNLEFKPIREEYICDQSESKLKIKTNEKKCL